MSLWVSILIRLDLHGQETGRSCYMAWAYPDLQPGAGHHPDHSYTFVFGAMIVWLVDRFSQKPPPKKMPSVTDVPARFSTNNQPRRAHSELNESR